MKKQRKLAAVTGASSGIGYELARQFLINGYDVIIAAENKEIYQSAKTLAGLGTVKSLQANLATAAGVNKFYKAIKADGRPLEALAINAGVGVSGDFARQTDLKEELNLIAVNITSAVHLAKLVLSDMVKRNAGRVLITSSIAAFAPGPYMATYNASKAFLFSFAQAIRHELKDTHVTVTALMPGATETNFFKRAGMEDTALGQAEKDDAADVARDGFEALMAGKDKVIAHSYKTKWDSVLERTLPAGFAAEMEGKESKPGSAAH